VIRVGVPSKGMIPWEDKMNPEEIQAMASYILNLQGTSPARPKEPQGELYEPKEEKLEAENVEKEVDVEESEA
jgi:cytochrome c oxidase cbb3-type subunit III